jgi:hypothetical protein
MIMIVNHSKLPRLVCQATVAQKYYTPYYEYEVNNWPGWLGGGENHPTPLRLNSLARKEDYEPKWSAESGLIHSSNNIFEGAPEGTLGFNLNRCISTDTIFQIHLRVAA